MSFAWLKRYMPRSLYGRAAFILILPVVTLQLVVSVVFIQRHFEGVTQQMSREMARAVNLGVSAYPTDPELMLPLDMIITPVTAQPQRDLRRWYDLTGLVVMRTLQEYVRGLQVIELPDDNVIVLYVTSNGQVYRVQTDRGRASPSNPHQLLVNMVFFGGLMTLIAFLYLRNQLRPITRLAQAAEAFGRGQRVPYSPSGAIEVRAAGLAFVEMRNRIERQIEQRTMMLSGVSHDLRTPLTRLRLGLSMIDDEDREPMERDVAEMQHLIDAFLDFAQSDASAAPAEPTDPRALVQRVVEDAQRAGQKVTMGAVEGDGLINLRPQTIRRALENLIGNAVRYGTHCRVSLRLTATSLCISVEDDGPGIAADAREDAMRPFVRLDPARNQNKGSGVGLGLAIAADIARAHGGVLRLRESPDMGGLRADILIAR